MIRADARVLGATIKAGRSLSYVLGARRMAYLVPSTGRIRVTGVMLDTGDGAAVRDESRLDIEALEDAEVVLVDAA
jgi:redox-sensitive bicupin YhaK (pirin superfamily)